MKLGCLWAPLETPEAFALRQEVLSQVSLPVESNLSIPLYDLHDLEAFVLYSNESLPPWQGAVLWEYTTDEGKTYPVIQMRKDFFRKAFGIYKKKEILHHELVHFVRFAFKEPFFEEMLAYQTASNVLRKFFGPLFMYPLESGLFAFVSFLAPMLSICLDSFIGVWLLLSMTLFFVTRLLVLHVFFALCKKKIKKILKLPSDALAVMVRLSDREIAETAVRSIERTWIYFLNQSKKEIRVQRIIDSYFKKTR